MNAKSRLVSPGQGKPENLEAASDSPADLAVSIATTDQLRDAIDRGLTGDKTAASDPAAAPLGTDEEAAGTPARQSQIRQAAFFELGREPISMGDRSNSWPLLVFVVAGAIMISSWLVALTWT